MIVDNYLNFTKFPFLKVLIPQKETLCITNVQIYLPKAARNFRSNFGSEILRKIRSINFDA
jgi:hypothetical protein